MLFYERLPLPAATPLPLVFAMICA